MPNTRPHLMFDDTGMCSACKFADAKKRIDWEARQAELEVILHRHKVASSSSYDCVIPVSGGKDSHWQTHVVLEYGLHPLCVTWVPCSQTGIGKKNVESLQEMGVDHIQFRSNPKVYNRLIREGFERVGDPCWPEHVGIFTVPVRVAMQYRIPLIVWGENPQFEYGGPDADAHKQILTRRWMEEYAGLVGMRVQDLVGVRDLTVRDLAPYWYPEDADATPQGIFLGYFLEWNADRQTKIIQKKYHFSTGITPEGAVLNYENLDCGFVALHDYMGYVKYGFGRATAQMCVAIRQGRIAREEAIAIVKESKEGQIPLRTLARFCLDLGYNHKQFLAVRDAFANPSLFRTKASGSFDQTLEGNLIPLFEVH